MKESWQTFLMEFQNPRRIVERIPERISLGIQGEIDDNIPGKRQSKFIKKFPRETITTISKEIYGGIPRVILEESPKEFLFEFRKEFLQ